MGDVDCGRDVGFELHHCNDLLRKNISASAASLSSDMQHLFKEELHISSTDILYRTNPGVGSQIVVHHQS